MFATFSESDNFETFETADEQPEQEEPMEDTKPMEKKETPPEETMGALKDIA